MPIPESDFIEFLELCDVTDRHTERECARYLEHAVVGLLDRTPHWIGSLTFEQRSPYGRSDFMIVAELMSDMGTRERIVDIWELKAPQCPIMQSDSQLQRFRPSQDLVSAETQLIHYVYQAQRDGDLQERWQIRRPQNIRAGGIIIGRDGRWLGGGDAEQNRLAEESFEKRSEWLYRPSAIRVKTWDRVLDILKPQEGVSG
ncbi:hypothetical protein FQ775_17135 [Nitratireductor mangrovi]|uniref:DUF4263 domain-containing protein n=1 Tax=Nitratireductor mangrovi TaxID=2599600 RepID=A0A5B8L2K7_9HYPH|nr:hypothetical protein [Nitratireductor mangrovi]QDZ01962.1 hypothetical protein FQ775_17135 [Nitratireductor mangrovi]